MTATELRELLARMGMTQREAGEIANVTLRTVQNWVAGATPVPDAIARTLLAEAAERAGDPALPPPQDQDTRRELLTIIARDQERRIAALERELADERAALAETRAMMDRAAASL